MSEINVSIQRMSDDVILPIYAKDGDAGMDVRSIKDVTVESHTTQIIPTGLKVAIPLGYEIQVRPRSGLSFKTNLRVANAPGTIDSGYRDEIGVIITNTGDMPITINKGDRVAQLVLNEVPKIKWHEVDDVSVIGTNRQGGFGSSGVK